MQPTQQIVNNPHDQFFREAMKDMRVAKEFFQTHLPKSISPLMDFNNLVLEQRSQTNAVRRESTVDLLFKTSFAKKDAYIYLLVEHQSSPDNLMALRVIEYTINAIRDHLKKYKTNKIPLVYPLVVYHGRPYEFINNINDLVEAPKDLIEQYFLKPFQLVDLNKIDDLALKQRVWSGIMEFVLKHIFTRDMLPFMREIAPALKKLTQLDGNEFIGIVLQYIIGSAEVSDKIVLVDLINNNISNEMGEKVMTLAEIWKQEGKIEGRIEGKIEGKLEIIKIMLANGVEPIFISKNTGIPLQEIRKLQKDLEII